VQHLVGGAEYIGRATTQGIRRNMYSKGAFRHPNGRADIGHAQQSIRRLRQLPLTHANCLFFKETKIVWI
jgi:hypothetical protein